MKIVLIRDDKLFNCIYVNIDEINTEGWCPKSEMFKMVLWSPFCNAFCKIYFPPLEKHCIYNIRLKAFEAIALLGKFIASDNPVAFDVIIASIGVQDAPHKHLLQKLLFVAVKFDKIVFFKKLLDLGVCPMPLTGVEDINPEISSNIVVEKMIPSPDGFYVFDEGSSLNIFDMTFSIKNPKIKNDVFSKYVNVLRDRECGKEWSHFIEWLKRGDGTNFCYKPNLTKFPSHLTKQNYLFEKYLFKKLFLFNSDGAVLQSNPLNLCHEYFFLPLKKRRN